MARQRKVDPPDVLKIEDPSELVLAISSYTWALRDDFRKRKPRLDIELTQAERSILRGLGQTHTRIDDHLKSRSPEPQVVTATVSQLADLCLELAGSMFRSGAKASLPERDLVVKLVARLEQARLELRGPKIDPAVQKAHEAKLAKSIFQIRILLEKVEPTIWRRILVPDCNLARLHNITQVVMGWYDEHLHYFDIDGVHYSSSEYSDAEDAERVKLSQVFPAGKRKFRFKYKYDMGDSWEHEILIEKILDPEEGQAYPVCIEGERACPPEDVGGPWGYLEFVEALEDPESADYPFVEDEDDFDPEAFDLEEVNKRLKRFRSKKR